MVKYGHDGQGYELNEDGTRIEDNYILRFIDRANGTAQRNRDKVYFDNSKKILDRTRDHFRGEGDSVFDTDPFFNPWAKGGTFNP